MNNLKIEGLKNKQYKDRGIFSYAAQVNCECSVCFKCRPLPDKVAQFCRDKGMKMLCYSCQKHN